MKPESSLSVWPGSDKHILGVRREAAGVRGVKRERLDQRDKETRRLGDKE